MVGESAPKWYRARRYVHFDAPLSVEQATRLVTNSERVAHQQFWPLLGLRKQHRRWSKTSQKFKKKFRPIAYASHADSHIFAYYAWALGALFEARLQREGLCDVVLAYRKHDRDTGRGKANYHFAADAFAEIVVRGDCEVVALDITKFFDSIPHKPLKEQWCYLLGVSELPTDQFAVFKAATRFAVVSLATLRKKCGIGLRKMRRISRLPLSGREFRDSIRDEGLVNRNVNAFGIPQGLPISGFLANLVMLDVDLAMHRAARASGASYRRYSDDILLICPPGRSHDLESGLEQSLSGLQLKIQDEKTLHVRFHKSPDGMLSADRPLQYLGLTFDGQRVLVRPQTIVRFLKRMTRGVARAAGSARKSGRGFDGKFRLRKRDLYNRYSHLPMRPREPKGARVRGTFFDYIERASSGFDASAVRSAITVEIKRQLRGAWRTLQRQVDSAEAKLNQVV